MHRASYLRVFLTFARNSLVRNMMFRANFIIECISSLSWMLMNIGFYILVFSYTKMLARRLGQVRVFCIPRNHAVCKQPGGSFLHAQCRGV